jgi:hypothetical protein
MRLFRPPYPIADLQFTDAFCAGVLQADWNLARNQFVICAAESYSLGTSMDWVDTEIDPQGDRRVLAKIANSFSQIATFGAFVCRYATVCVAMPFRQIAVWLLQP